MMGGALNYRKKGKIEHNVRYDVAAAQKVFYSPVPKRYVLSDTTSNLYSRLGLIPRSFAAVD